MTKPRSIVQWFGRLSPVEKVLAALGVLYTVSPLDFLPLNPIDDMVIMGLVAGYLYVKGSWRPGMLVRAVATRG